MALAAGVLLAACDSQGLGNTTATAPASAEVPTMRRLDVAAPGGARWSALRHKPWASCGDAACTLVPRSSVPSVAMTAARVGR